MEGEKRRKGNSTLRQIGQMDLANYLPLAMEAK